MNIQQAIEEAQIQLTASNKSSHQDAKVDAYYLLSFILQKNFTWLKTWPEKSLTDLESAQWHKLLARRVRGEPIAYITGEKEFWTLRLETNQSTLIPRPETELLVERALEFLAQYDSARVLDLGTGTGAIGLAIASERKGDQIIATDYQQQAVDLARRNAENNQLLNVRIIHSDWFSNIDKDPFELIVSNPPYVVDGDPHLNQGDLVFEPNSALVSDDDGLGDINRITTHARDYLKPGGALMIEHGFEQGKAVRNSFETSGFISVETLTDLAGLDRMTMGMIEC